VHPFRAAVEAGDIDAAVALMADDVEFRSPAVYKPYRGRESAAILLRAVARVFEDFHYVREIGAENSREHALVFRARVGATEVEGCDLLHLDDAGRIDELVVMIRPLSGLTALVEAMRVALESRPTP